MTAISCLNTINTHRNDDTTSFEFSKITSDEFEKTNNKDHVSYLSWNLVRYYLDPKQAGHTFDHTVSLYLLQFVNQERYPEAKICELNLRATHPATS